MNLSADQAEQSTRGTRRIVVPERGPCRCLEVTLRQETPAREQVNGAAKSASAKSDHLIDGRQARSYEKDVGVLRNAFESVGGPGEGNVARTFSRFARQQGIAGRKIADGENHFLRENSLTATQVNRREFAGSRNSAGLIVLPFEIGVECRDIAQNRFDILPIDAAWQIAARFDGTVIIGFFPVQ